MRYSKTTGGFYADDIKYPNPPADLVAVDEAAYKALMAAQSAGQLITDDGSGNPQAVDPPARPKYPDIDAARAAMVAFVDRFLIKITGAVPEYERASWPAKAEAARAYEAGTARPDQAAMIANEATSSGRTDAAVASVIVARADQYQEIIAHTAGLRVKTDLALEAVTDPNDYETVLVAAQADAIALAQSLGITVTP